MKCKGYINENGNMEIYFPYKKGIIKILKLNGKYHKFFEVDVDFNTMEKRSSILEKIHGEEDGT